MKVHNVIALDKSGESTGNYHLAAKATGEDPRVWQDALCGWVAPDDCAYSAAYWPRARREGTCEACLKVAFKMVEALDAPALEALREAQQNSGRQLAQGILAQVRDRRARQGDARQAG